MKTAKEYLDLAEAALDAGKMDEYQTNMAAAKAAQELDAAKKSLGRDPVRLPQPQTIESDPVTDKDAATKAWAAKRLYTKKYGEPDAAFDQIVEEIYPNAGGYYNLAAMKHLDFNRYLKSGRYDPRLAKTIVLTQDQIAEAIVLGNSVSDIRGELNEALGDLYSGTKASTMVESTDTLGGYAVPEDFQQGEIISRLPGLTVVRPLANVKQTVRDAYSVLSRTGGTSRYIGNVRVTPIDESPTGTTSATNATFGKITIPIHTLLADVSLSRSVLEDAVADLGQELGEEFATARALQEDEYYLVGNGVGVPEGILKNSTTGGPFNSNITTIVTGDANHLASGTAAAGKGLIAVPYGLSGQYRQNGAVWAMAKGSVAETRGLSDGMSRPLWTDNNNALAAGQPERLLGYPVKESEALGAVTANYYPIIFGDFKGYRIVDRIGMTIERYLDSTTAATDTVRYFMRWRGGGKVTDGWRFVVVKVSAA